jgi:poly(3-hydroxybutyrate) depolymerase/formylglycine-generating enzyme required for sulfatase activity
MLSRILCATVFITCTSLSSLSIASDELCSTSPTDNFEIRYPYLSDEAETRLVDDWKAGLQAVAEQQSYLLYIPAKLPDGPVPLVVVIPGDMAIAPDLSGNTHLKDAAEERKFILAYPNKHDDWNTDEGSTDVDYIRAIVADVESNHCLDKRRIYGAAYAGGGTMAARLACDAADIFAAMTLSQSDQVGGYEHCLSLGGDGEEPQATDSPFVLSFATSTTPYDEPLNTQSLDFMAANSRAASMTSSGQVQFEWLTVGNPGNAADISSGFGAVDHSFLIAKYEVTNAQYAQFLNAKAVTDPLNLYSVSMGAGAGGITRSGVPGSYSYSAMPGRELKPVNWVSYYDVLRFTNWMHNGQGDGDTETGAYTLEGGMAVPFNAETVQRNIDARVFLPTEDEWYKSAYHNAKGLKETDYFLYPFRSDEVTSCSPPPGGENHANCARAVTDVVDKGSYPESIGPYGTLDQGGNVWEWNVGLVAGALPVMRGGGYYIGPGSLESSWQDQWAASGEFSFAGFRVAAPTTAAAPAAATKPVAKSSSGGGPISPLSLLTLLMLLVFSRRFT